MIQDWMFYAAALLIVIAFLYIWGTRRRIDELECDVSYLKDSVNRLFEDRKKSDKEIIEFRKRIEEHQGTMQVCSSTMSNAISKLEKRIDILETAESIDEKESDNPPSSEAEFWANKSDLADIVDPDEKPALEWPRKRFEIIGYRWVFPSKDQCVPVYGQRYMVVGILHGHETMDDGSPFICTEEATWDRYKFVIDSGVQFDKVYAWIKMPDSSDIMKSILEISLHDREA